MNQLTNLKIHLFGLSIGESAIQEGAHSKRHEAPVETVDSKRFAFISRKSENFSSIFKVKFYFAIKHFTLFKHGKVML
jgi:hypothetical protein